MWHLGRTVSVRPGFYPTIEDADGSSLPCGGCGARRGRLDPDAPRRPGLTGLSVAGLAVVANQGLRGVAIGGVHVEGRWIEGLAVSPIRTRTWDLTGMSVAGYNRIKGEQHGITIGLYNYARSLHGVQLGIINNARNNRGLFRVLPLVNIHMD